VNAAASVLMLLLRTAAYRRISVMSVQELVNVSVGEQ
jgi:hypothetical protein